jgi:hypothetical protein
MTVEILTFATPDVWKDGVGFGCATLGPAGTDAKTVSAMPLEGITLTGSYVDILKGAATVQVPVHAAVVLFGNAGGENEFLKQLQSVVNCLMVGGGAAFSETPGLVTGGGEAAVFLITDSRYTYETVTQCIHDEILETCRLELADPRTLLRINGEDAAAYLARKKGERGLAATDFEHLTLTTENGINAHLSFDGTHIKSGRDLDETMVLRAVSHENVYGRMRTFYDDPDAVIFGCAGLSGLLDQTLDTPSVGLFLFGEVCTVDGKAEFGNLMLSKLRILKK